MLIDYLNNEILTSLTKTEQNILQYVYKNAEQVQNFTIRELGRALNVSTTTVLRFCKKLQLSGYSELKYLLKDFSPLVSSEIKKEPDTLQEITSLIENTLLLLREEDLEQVIDILESKKDLHLFCGGGISGTVLDYLEDLLFSIGRQGVYRYESARLAFHIAESFTEKDVLFVISTSGFYEQTLKMVNLATIKNIDTVAITPYTDNPIANLATINFRFFSKSHTNSTSEYHSRLPIFYIIDMIFKGYLLKKEAASDE